MVSPSARSYFYSLGQFVHAYAQFENVVHMTFFSFAKIPPRTAAAIKRGTKVSDLISITKALLIENEFTAEERQESDAIFAQFDHIATFRDRVIHRGAAEQPDGTFFSSNLATAKAPAKSIEAATFKPTQLKRATGDLARMSLRLALLSQIWGTAEITDRIRREKGLFSPWRYKPVKLEILDSQRQAERRTRRHPLAQGREKSQIPVGQASHD